MTLRPHTAHGPKLTHAVNCLVLAVVVLVSSLPYMRGLGFYSDDWETLAGFVQRGAHAEVVDMLTPGEDTLLRPVQVVYLIAAMTAFGQNPLPYHLAAALLLVAAALSVYAAAFTLLRNRGLSLVVALLFSLLPQYSTDRFWTSSQQAVLCLIFAMLGVCALLRSGHVSKRAWLWPVLAMLCFLLSLTAYEVSIGLIGAALLVAGWRWYRTRSSLSGPRWPQLLALAGVVTELAAVSAGKLLLQQRLAMRFRFLHHMGERMLNTLSVAFQFNFWTYVLHMPALLWKLTQNGALSRGAWLASFAIAVGVAALLWRSFDPSSLPARRQCLKLIGVGLVLWWLGFALFFAAPHNPFATAGPANRVAIAAAPGAAVVLVALLGLAASVAGSPTARVRAFAVLAGIAAGANCLAVNGIAHYWVVAARQQQQILLNVKENVPGLPHNGVLLVDGFCRYAGPAPVFENESDMSGAVRLLFGDPSLSGSVVAPNTAFDISTVATMMYDEVAARFPYSTRLFIYHLPSRTLTPVPTRDAAMRYIAQTKQAGSDTCPVSVDGEGTRVF